jgi:hypothetical protein
VSSTSELQRPNKEAKVDKFFGVDAAGRRRDTVMSPTSSYANGSEKSWFLQSDIDAADVVFNMEGNVKGGTLHALVQRLTQHDQLGNVEEREITYLFFFFANILIHRFQIQYHVFTHLPFILYDRGTFCRAL